MKLLLHPRVTLAALVAGLSSLATGLVTTIIALRPLGDLRELLWMQPWLLHLDAALGVAAALAMVLCAIGRSIVAFVDDDGK
jgi:hypothetical protein